MKVKEGMPYPYGYVRDSAACNIDRLRKGVGPKESLLGGKPWSEETGKHLAQLWAGVAAGSMSGCVSASGVYDLTGNVDEWAVWEPGGRPKDQPWNSMMKGGFWGPVRNRCQASTSAHGPQFSFYQQGFRCCSNATP